MGDEMNWLETEIHRKYHEVASLFPLMEGDEFEALKADIGENGLIEAIWLHPDESIIDGRNRHRACVELEIQPRFRTWNGAGSLVSFVVSMNLHRRHLNSSQRAACSLGALEMLEMEAKERMLAGVAPDPSQKVDQGKATEQAAQLFNTNRQYVSDAKKLQQEAPDLLEQVKSGDITIPQAKRDLNKRQRQDAPPMPTDKYRIIYADPPWKYSNKGLDDYGHAERHYPTMSIGELCNMGEGVKELVDGNAVMFLWATSPMLEDSFKVINSWGFKYKTSFVWDKVHHNFGHYNSVRHEFLLICTRGSCTPDVQKLFDSVQVIERTNMHSEKPQEFRDIIDTLYPYGKRIELFARMNADGWETWGNEPG